MWEFTGYARGWLPGVRFWFPESYLLTAKDCAAIEFKPIYRWVNV